ncbi:MAG: CinA family protein [Oleibacter sp.]|nr:CinA family protein [Thalassolituus sp.]
MSESTTELCQQLAQLLRAKKQRLVTAESCTGGLVATLCTDLAGSSDWFECGFVTYSNTAKMRDLGVPAAVLLQYGAVSEATVRAMVAGAARYGHVAVAISGIAGPGGAVEGKPVGTVWLACGHSEQQLTETHCFGGDRDAVRQQSAIAALKLIIRWINTQ